MTKDELITLIRSSQFLDGQFRRIKGYNNYLRCDFCGKLIASMYDNDLEGSVFSCMDCWELIKDIEI